MTDKTIIFLAFIICAVVTINIFHICHTWRIVTIMNLVGLPKESENNADSD